MQAQKLDERRRSKRVAFDAPVPAAIAGVRILLLDVSNAGARIEHEAPLAVRREVRIRFDRGDDSFQLSCEAVRCRLQRSATRPGSVTYISGIRFTASAGQSREKLRLLVAQMLGSVAGEREVEDLSAVAV